MSRRAGQGLIPGNVSGRTIMMLVFVLGDGYTMAIITVDVIIREHRPSVKRVVTQQDMEHL